ncbi:MAG TPA: cytochrome c-type biogenesis CcmF C-terminal domain-containing protein, partial [Burkholderiales bacterium]|nr:cytochrome c-type biogenesis CcmF C-terminal domain-containing protein [Burkholderiales bacterium]
LGWGGYWAWDPVENASFMPWLLGTALVHSITVQDRRQMLHTWNIFLAISTFALSLLGTFLVRSGVLSSVHAFAVDPGRGAYILAFMVLVLALSFGVFLARGRYQEARETITSFFSRESLFIWNNVLFVLACACVLLGTLYPLALDALYGDKITVAAPFFNIVMVPIFLAVLLMMGIGPLVPWRKANVERLRRRLLIPAIVGVIAAIGMSIFMDKFHWTAPVALGLTIFAFAAVVTDYWRAVQIRRQQIKDGLARTLYKTVAMNRRHYGGMIVHTGIVVIALGLTGSGLFRSEASVVMMPGDVVTIAGEELRFDGVRELRRDNYAALQAKLTLLNSGRALFPEKRRYPRQEDLMTESGIDSTPLRDVYAVVAEPVGQHRWSIHVYVNPLVQFIWGGGFVILAGLFLSLSGRRQKKSETLV